MNLLFGNLSLKTFIISFIADKSFYMIVCTIYILLGLAFTSTIIEIVR